MYMWFIVATKMKTNSTNVKRQDGRTISCSVYFLTNLIKDRVQQFSYNTKMYSKLLGR